MGAREQGVKFLDDRGNSDRGGSEFFDGEACSSEGPRRCFAIRYPRTRAREVRQRPGNPGYVTEPPCCPSLARVVGKPRSPKHRGRTRTVCFFGSRARWYGRARAARQEAFHCRLGK